MQRTEHGGGCSGVRDGGRRLGELGARCRTPATLAERLRTLVVGLRWLTVVVGAVAVGGRAGEVAVVGAAAALIGVAGVGTVPRFRQPGPARPAAAAVAAEYALTIGAAAATGGLASPFALSPLTALLVAGYLSGRRAGVGTAVAGALAAVATVVLQAASAVGDGEVSRIAAVYLLCGTLGAFGRNLVVEVEAQRAAALDQAAEMATANELLVALHGLAQTLPASFDLGEVVGSIRQRLRSTFRCSAIVVLVHDDTASGWLVELAEGVRMAPRLGDDELPRPLRRAIAAARPTVVHDRLLDPGDDAFAALARSGMYAPLRSRGALVGLLAIEDVPPGSYSADDAALLDNLTSVLALAVDNALWFRRLHTLGAESERARIARDLHDRIAQSLAYVAFELERMQAGPAPMLSDIVTLHGVVRDIVGELRETIHELRTNVDQHVELVEIAGDYLARWSARTGVHAVWECDADTRLSPQVEQEVWRIMQEALTNIERHASAARVVVSWWVENGDAHLVVADDGRGFDPAAVRPGRYGLVGMRERADAIGARLVVDTAVGAGTTVRLDLEPLAGRSRRVPARVRERRPA